jgi:hypothetical protein
VVGADGEVGGVRELQNAAVGTGLAESMGGSVQMEPWQVMASGSREDQLRGGGLMVTLVPLGQLLLPQPATTRQ